MTTAKTLKSVGYQHEAMIDLILQDPTVTTSELAAVMGYSSGWISRILASDSFQVRLAQRKAALIDPIIARSLNERLRAVAMRSMDVIESKLDSEESLPFAVEALGIAQKGLTTLSGKPVR